MADKKPAAAAPADAAAKPKLPLVPIIGAALGSAGLVAGLMFFMMPKPAAPAEGDEAAEHASEGEDGEGEAKAEARYIEIKEPLVVNLTGGDAKYLQVKAQIATRSEPGQKAIETHMPALQNRLLAMLRQTSAEDLAKPDSMTTLQDKAKDEANALLEEETGKDDTVSAVVFTSFVKQ
jgi:flagellar basal body-associated protein FliL